MFYNLEEAARVLGMRPQDLKFKAMHREIRAFMDGGHWRFRVVDIDELARRRGIGSDSEETCEGVESDSEETCEGVEFEEDSPAPTAIESKTLENRCKLMRKKLHHNHLWAKGREVVAIQDSLALPGSNTIRILGEGFHRLIVLDLRMGMSSTGDFSLSQFLRYARDRMAIAFEIALNDAYHPEQISQILKDEPTSLFCFLNAQMVTVVELRGIRGFTQEQHRVLFCLIPLNNNQ
jgi:hypothetical protein